MASEEIIVAILAIVYSVLTVLLQHTIGNRKRTQEIQKEMGALQKKITSAAKAGDEPALKKLEPEQARMTGLMMESMKLQFKPLLFILPVFILLFGGFGFHGLLFEWFPDFEHPLPVALHLNGEELLGLNILHESLYGVRGYFLVVLFFVGIALQALVVPLIERLFKKTGHQQA